ncbi:complex I NDUFA9 subunit family protein [Chitinivorax sp. B]|uniref:complex I NDUFA9 subunit family protein n=1 Tax=Chitinivorax sp. B TaxID=2502235 RepID=UPI0010F9CA59|nr:complex I NDUFA9 subunit family protein [Chitinivorax sp. B]
MATALIIGGSGFIGHLLAAALVKQEWSVIVPTRRYERQKADLLVLPNLQLVETNVHESEQLDGLVAHSDVVINLVGILQGSEDDFEKAHVGLPTKLVAACQRAGKRRLVHISALGANEQGPSRYLRSKGRGEKVIRASGLDFTILRPSVVFGEGDSFLNMFAKLQRWFPVLPLACPDARFQPIWVMDVVQAVTSSLAKQEVIGATLELGGPQQYTLRELVDYVGQLTGHRRAILGLTGGLATLQALMLERLPGKLMSRDNIASMSVPNVTDGGFPAMLGFTPTALEAIAPGYLADATPRRRYDHYRANHQSMD